jgi:hypothetical protein
MPSVINKIEQVLTESDVDVLINVQVGQLGTVEVSFRQFATNAKAEIKSFIDGMSSIPLPTDLRAQSLEDFFNAYLDVFPQQISGVSLGLSEKSNEIINHVNTIWVTPLEQFFELYRCIDELLLRIDGVGFAGNSAPQDTAPFASVKLMFSTSLKEGLEELSEALGDIESPLTGVESMMMLLGVFISFIPREYFSTAQSPFIEEIRRLIETAQTWEDLAASDLATKILGETEEIQEFLEAIFEDEEIQALIIAVETATTTLKVAYDDANPSQDIIDTTQNLDNLAIGISGYADANSPNHSTALTEVNEALANLSVSTTSLETNLQSISTAFFDSEADDNLAQALEDLTDQLEEKMLEIFNQLKSEYQLDLVPLFPETFAAKEIDLDFDDLLDAVKEGLDWLCTLIQKLNLENLSNDFEIATNDLNQKIIQWDDALQTFVEEVNTRLTNLNTEIEEFNTAAIEEDIKASINDYQIAVQDEVLWILTKIRTEIDDFVELAETTAGNYSHQDLEDSLNTFIQSLSQVLMQYLQHLNKVKSAVNTAGDKLKNQSFKAVSDLVVNQIDKATTDLEGIDPQTLNSGVRLALTLALDVLPSEKLLLEKVKQLKAKLDEAIENGPIALIEKYKDKTDELLEKIKEKSPWPLVKNELDEQYQKIVTVLEGVEPSNLLNPIDEKLSEIDDTIESIDNPCKVLDSAVILHAKLLAALEHFDTEGVLSFLEAEKAKIDAAVEKAYPEPYIDEIIEGLVEVAEEPDKLSELLMKIKSIAGKFSDPVQQIDDWLETLYNKIDELFDLQDFVDEIGSLIQNTEDEANAFANDQIDLRVRFKLASLLGVLQVLDPQDQLSNLLQAYNNLKVSPIDGLPEPERTAVNDFLDDFELFKPIIEVNLEAFQALKEKLEDYKKKLTDWRHVFFGPHSPLFECIPTADTLKDCVEAAFKPPLLALLSSTPQIAAFVDELTELLDDFNTGCLPDISGLSTGLAQIKNTVQTVKVAILDIDMSTVQNLESIYTSAKGKLENLDVAGLQEAVCQAFEELRNSMKVSEILSESDIQSLDATYASLMEIANAFDPVKWVEETLEPEFQRLLEPYLEPFDLTKFFEELLERMEVLKKELREELDRIHREFMEMLAAVPRIEVSAPPQIAI